MNPILAQTEEAIYANLQQPQLKPVIQKVVEQGKRVMYSPESRELLIKQMQAPGDQSEIIGAGVAKLVGILYNQSKNTIPMEVMVPASTILLCEGLDFLEQGGAIQVTNDVLADCLQATASNLLQLFGITPDKLQGMIDEVGGQQSETPAPMQPTQPAEAASGPPAAGGGIIQSARGGA